MEIEKYGSETAPRINQIFYNDRGLRAGWRLFIYLGMLALLVFCVSLVTKHLGGQPSPGQLSPVLQTILQMVVELILFLVLLLLAWIMSKIERRKLGVYGLPLRRSVFPQFIVGYFLWGFVPLAVLLSILRAFHAFYFGDAGTLSRQILTWGIAWLFFFILVGLLEEYSLRGYFLYTLGDGIGFWPAAVIQAILFARLHMGNEGETRIGIVATAFFALFAAATLWRTGSLWLAVGAHAGWDWGQSFFFGVNDSGFQAPGHLFNPHIGQGPIWLTGGTVGPEGSVVTLILWALMTLVFVWLYRKRREPLLVFTTPKN